MNKFAVVALVALVAVSHGLVSSRILFNSMTVGTAVGQESHYNTPPQDADIVIGHSSNSGAEDFNVVNHAFCVSDAVGRCLFHEASGGSDPVGDGTLSFIPDGSVFAANSLFEFRYACTSGTVADVVTYDDNGCSTNPRTQTTLTCDIATHDYSDNFPAAPAVGCVRFEMTNQNFPTALYIDGYSSGDNPTQFEPHFYSLSSREQYLVTGDSGEVYNIISSPTESMNYRFITYEDHPTWANGVWIEEASLVVCADGAGENCHMERKVRVFLENNKLVVEVDGVRTSGEDQTNLDNAGRFFVNEKSGKVSVQTYKFMVHFFAAGEDKYPFINALIIPVDGAAGDYAHGLFGQTGSGPVNEDAPDHSTAKWVEGEISQYKMESLFATEFEYSRYG